MQNRQKEIARLLRMAGAVGKDWKDIGMVLASQAGHYCQLAYHATAMPSEELAHQADARRALGDMIVQIQLACELLHFDFDQVAVEGFLAFRDQMQRVERTNKSSGEDRHGEHVRGQ